MSPQKTNANSAGDVTTEVVVIGAGPGGYVAAIRCAQLGHQVTVVEKGAVGGVCLNVGCIPSKALIAAGSLREKILGAGKMGLKVSGVEVDLKAMVQWKAGIVERLTGGIAGLFQSHKIQLLTGSATFAGPGQLTVETAEGARTVRYQHAILATGSRPVEIPGFAFDGKAVWSSTEALAPDRLPGHVLVIGGGYIGLELGFCYRKLGAEVTVVEMTDTVLPGIDPELARVVARSLKKKKMAVHVKTRAVGFTKKGKAYQVELDVGGKKKTVEVDQILSAVGRRPNTEGLGLETLGLKPDEKGFLPVDAQRRTQAAGVYAIGDVAGQPMLAHKASHEGLVAAAAIHGDRKAAYDPVAVPAVIFTDPEVATVGMTEAEAKEAGFDPVVGKFPFAASGRALSLNETEGFVKVVADKTSDVVLGVHMVGPEVTELIAEAGLALEMGATTEDLAHTIHAHPTLPETLMEAAEAVHGMAVHVFQPPGKGASA